MAHSGDGFESEGVKKHGRQGQRCAAGPALGSSEHLIPVHSVGHVGVKRIVAIDEHDSAAMVVMDISVGLYAHQRGAHMSRLIECVDRPGPQPTVLDYTQGIFERLRGAVPDAASGSVDARRSSCCRTTAGSSRSRRSAGSKRRADRGDLGRRLQGLPGRIPSPERDRLRP